MRQRALILSLRLALTLGVCYGLYQALGKVQSAFEPPDLSAEMQQRFEERVAGASPPARTPPRGRRIDFPWPRYPGAEIVMEYQGEDAHDDQMIQVLEVSRAPDQALAYYQRQMEVRGWRLYEPGRKKPPPDAQKDLESLQAMQAVAGGEYLRRVDRARQRLLMLQKGDRLMMVEVQPKDSPTRQEIQLVTFRMPTPEEHMTEISGGLHPIRPGSSILEYEQSAAQALVGRELVGSRIFTTSRKPAHLYRQLERLLESEGWTPADGPARLADHSPHATHAGYFARGNDVALVVVSPHDDQNGASAMMTKIQSGP